MLLGLFLSLTLARTILAFCVNINWFIPSGHGTSGLGALGQTLTDGEDIIDNDGVDAFFDLLLLTVSTAVQGPKR